MTRLRKDSVAPEYQIGITRTGCKGKKQDTRSVFWIPYCQLRPHQEQVPAAKNQGFIKTTLWCSYVVKDWSPHGMLPTKDPRKMNKVFREQLDKFSVVFLNILNCPKSEKEHGEYLRLVLRRLGDQQKYAKFNTKSDWLKEVESLRCVLSEASLTANPNKIADVLN